MKPIEFKSTMVAGLIGAALLVAIDLAVHGLVKEAATPTGVWVNAGLGFVIGAGVQIGVRLTGVS